MNEFGLLGPFESALGCLLGSLGRFLGRLGAILGILGRYLGDSGPSGAVLGASRRGLLGPSWAPLGPGTVAREDATNPRGRAGSPGRFGTLGSGPLRTA